MDFKELTSQIENFGQNYPSYWGCALAGELGEAIEKIDDAWIFLLEAAVVDHKLTKSVGKACDLIKKHEREGKEIQYDLSKELADIFIYLELIARIYGIDLEEAILQKLEIVKQRRREQK